MHYYIDGYNLLFRTNGAGDDFSNSRQIIIDDLNTKIQLLEIEATIVFDAQYQLGESSRSHFQHLEILFSGHGMTADELILDEIKSERFPHKKVVVTSDKKLAWFARRCSAKTESVEEFISWLNKRYHNKIRHQATPPTTKEEQKKTLPLTKKKPDKFAPVESCQEYYLTQFEEKFEKIKEEKIPRPRINVEAHPKPKANQKQGVSDKQRWLNIFEQRLNEENEDE